MREWLLVAAGGAAGACARYGLDRLGQALRLHPTLAIAAANIIGSFLIGLIAASALISTPQHVVWRHGVSIGLLGAFTTFSTFSLHSLTLMSDGRWLAAGANVGGSVALCLLACGAGLALGRTLA